FLVVDNFWSIFRRRELANNPIQQWSNSNTASRRAKQNRNYSSCFGANQKTMFNLKRVKLFPIEILHGEFIVTFGGGVHHFLAAIGCFFSVTFRNLVDFDTAIFAFINLHVQKVKHTRESNLVA